MRRFKKVVEWKNQDILLSVVLSFILLACSIGVWFVEETMLKTIIFSLLFTFSIISGAFFVFGGQDIKRKVYWVEIGKERG